ncbi:MAG: hypothetical protein PHY11_03025 [Bacilli bacterium]|nr:hypothetical protein [Bacilli bacterium]MDD4065950.1 hypothetical protein [Bacilli bacterium]
MYFGVIDIGSTTLRMSLYKHDNNMLSQMYNKKVFTRLSDYVKDGSLSIDGMDAIIQGMKQYLEEISNVPSVKVFCFATAFIRELNNFQAIISEIYNRLMIHVEVLSTAEEAKYALSGFLHNERIDKSKGLLVGVGGTSTLLVYYENGTLVNYASLALGSIRELKPLFQGIVPTKEEAIKMKKYINGALEKLNWIHSCKVKNVYAVSGNGRAFARIHKDLNHVTGDTNEYDIPMQEVNEVVKALLSFKDQHKAVLYLNEVVPGRINSFVPSAIILETIMEYVKAEQFKTAKYGLREGFLLSHDLTNKE